MKLLDDLRAEHALIERVTGSLRTFVERRLRGEVDGADGEAFVRFFHLYAGRHHHAREEEILFPALASETEVPLDRGPLRVLFEDHRSMEQAREAMAPLLSSALDTPAARDELFALSERFGRALLLHIDAENSVLFPESEARFRRVNLRELPDRAPDADEEAARAGGERLAMKYPQSEFPGLLRGEGCVACEAYGVRCDGVEREWFDEQEFEDTSDRVGD
jgi:hemerythrin-like domain-containing protein